MGEENKNYEVGYGKPPKNTQFKKGVSGNPNGRPKKILDFDQELLREARSLITINEGGRNRRISKHLAVIKQMTNNAIKGTTAGLRMYRDSYRQAFETVTQSAAEQAKERERLKNVRELTEEELNYFLLKALQEEKKLDEDFRPIRFSPRKLCWPHSWLHDDDAVIVNIVDWWSSQLEGSGVAVGQG